MEHAEGSIVIEAPLEDVMEVIEDYEAYPEWADVRSVEVRERGEGGRATEVAYVVDVPVLGSSLQRFAGGWIARRHNVGARKLRTLAEQGVSPPFAVAYSDSSADLAMLGAAQRVVLVAPRPAQRARIAARLRVDEVIAG